MTLPQDSGAPTEALQPGLLQQIAALETLLAEAKQREIEQEEVLATERAQRRIAEALHRASLVLNSSLAALIMKTFSTAP
jgi:hypothetical protein